ncbi:DNA-binding CsgD family transcriptional regulator [Rhodovulum iodosum]|uniref:DNA-binding CsgD family transcriptional regulator n=1 Tax=Rhodovulum iodosum TaxID=68291 RepID=A0ABV3XUD7_9RHOB|nr:LuxR family transcriptional regulator [Rhodovulum robiginosum]RSK35007.1 LuxR family transcriptional regulator [Rhodovulum robiginosum]
MARTSLEDYLADLIDARSVERVWALHTAAMAGFGFDRLLYGYTRFRTASSLGEPEDSLILSNHSPEYVRAYIDQRSYFNAPMVAWANTHVGACSWGLVAERAGRGELCEGERDVLALNRAMGVTAGYTISFPETSSRAKGAIGLTGRRGLSQQDVDEIWQAHGRRLEIMNNVMHLKLVNLPYAARGRSLTQRQREVLQWVGDGKTTQDIATIMGLTPATVEKHLRLARKALDVDTTAQAVLKASFQNQIFLVEA